MMTIRSKAGSRKTAGFSLIEVMVAVVVLATGLLALAALQGSLTRASAEAKVRGRVAAMLTARLDELRMQSSSLADTGASPAPLTSTTEPCDPVNPHWLHCAREEAGVGSLSVSQQVQSWSGATSFTQAATTDPEVPQFKRIRLTATWTSADNSTHTLTSATDVSAYSLVTSLIPPPDESSAGGQNPVVRQDSPVTAGMIPIALGNGQSSAASNPAPEVMGKGQHESIVGTRFNVLTYAPQGDANQSSIIQRRFENALIRCKCQYGAAGDGFASLPAIYRAPQWPAVWTGERYDIFEPSAVTAAPGTTLESAPVNNEIQSPLCTECCRDHHDTALTGAGRYDPERTDGVGKYGIDNQGDLTANSVNNTNGTYVNACRVIRVDGFWRTASDTYARHFGLLATETVSFKQAATGVPDNAVAGPGGTYEVFVKDYLAGYSGTATPAAGTADSLFNDSARGLNAPTSITINRPSPKDERYLHARGLYVDFLEQEAREKLADALEDCTTTPTVNCILPYLPFTSINVTELAFWQPIKDGAQSDSILSVTSGSSLIYDPLQPTRGRTNALSSAGNGDTADSAAFITPSNSGLAVSAQGVDPQDDNDLTDAQTFAVSAPGTPGTGGRFSVQLTGLPQTSDENTSNDPAVAYTITTDSGNCVSTLGTKKDKDPNPYGCSTNTTLPAASGTVLLANYWREDEEPLQSSVVIPGGQCTYEDNLVTIQATTVQVPIFSNYEVATAVMPGSVVTIGTAANDGNKAEATQLTLTPVVNNATLTVGFSLQGNAATRATFVSCTADYVKLQGNNYAYVLGTVVWNRPWQ